MEIKISALELWTHIGVPREERVCEQRMLASVRISCKETASKSDAIAETIDYNEVIDAIKACSRLERKTLEKFSADIADAILAFDRVEHVEVSLTKHLLPGTKGITVTLSRSS